MKNNLVIDFPEKIEDNIEDFKQDSLDTETNYTAAKIKVTRDPESNNPIVFYSQELSRNFKDHSDKFAKRHIIKAFTPSNMEAVADTTLERKFSDTILAFKNQIPDYSPLSDIHSEKMKLFMDEDSATFLSDIGINIDGLGEDFGGLQSVSANPFMEDIAYNASQLKTELAELRGKYMLVKIQMSESFEADIDPQRMSDSDFAECMALENVNEGLVQAYLAFKEKIKTLESKLGIVSTEIFNETKSKIRLPKSLEGQNNALLQI
ncbi:MAG: hypothetical protein D8M58_21905 [Calditrichaeota bacterium]|nr:MAG: hypothetical protein DWQ03_00570 [Calditrichota bacterium]MBL1208071.1 hypothetical protein [Calditrichota bacterium]NOG47908.1 hypothetical protein [Calditrichota bacterium]